MGQPPFEPVIKTTPIHPDGAIFARGACDDKGQFFMHVKALEQMIASNSLPCNVKVMIEGEEEVGSDHLEDFVRANLRKAKSRCYPYFDTGIGSIGQPSLQGCG